ncbi:MAG: hypothetical protein BWK75_06120 [Candidatus Altiarchaeales archaeon A3]|nr:MAG: hypothetical protein BWK75_06120 [Candidatus Altiarchaeales archaeon A3]
MKEKLVIIGGIIIICLFLLYALQPSENSHEKQKNLTLISKNIEDIKYSSTFYGFSPTSNPSFSIGEKYIYKIWTNPKIDVFIAGPNTTITPIPSESKIEMGIDGIERINKENYFHCVVSGEDIKLTSLVCKKGTCRNNYFHLHVNGSLFYIHTKNSTIIHPISNRSNCRLCYYFYSPWMLYLQNNIKWNEKIQSVYKGIEANVIYEYTVEGIEKVNERKCFKIIGVGKSPTIKSTGKGENEKTAMSFTVVKNIFWVDVEKRILVKMEEYEDNIIVNKIELQQIVNYV